MPIAVWLCVSAAKHTVASLPSSRAVSKFAAQTVGNLTHVATDTTNSFRTVSGPGSAEEKADPAPHTVQTFFPSITNRVDNWRAFNPATLTVSPFPQMPITFDRISFKEDGSLTGGHYSTWVGRSPAMPGASLVTVGTDSGYDAILVVPGSGEMNFHVTGAGDAPGAVNMSAADSVDAGCGIGPVAPRPNLAPHTAAIYAANYVNATQSVSMPAAAIVAADGAPTVDLLYLYDSTMLDAVKTQATGDPAILLDGQFKVVTETVNLFLAQSGITTFKFKYLGLLPAPAYTRSGHLAEDLNAIVPGGAIGSWVSKTRYDYGADEMCLLVGTSLDFGGIANSNPQQPPTKDLASCVVAAGGGWGPTANFVSAVIVAHEIGHTLGCEHDRVTANIFKDGKYCYGWMTTATSITGSNAFTTSIGTIMSYASGRIPYYSNPSMTVDIYFELYNPMDTGSEPVGFGSNPDFGFFTIGAPTTDENPQYNAKVMADNGPVAANLMDPISPPVITQQPSATVTLTAGQDLTLTVTALGGGLYYQWNKDGAAIAGATAAIFTRSSLITSDAGNYTVLVSNRAAAVTSDKATLTVASAPISPPTTPSTTPATSSGGDGGAGSIEGWFVFALFALGAARTRTARREVRNGHAIFLLSE